MKHGDRTFTLVLMKYSQKNQVKKIIYLRN